MENMKEGRDEYQQSPLVEYSSNSFEAPQLLLGLESILCYTQPVVTVVSRAALPCRDRNETEMPSWLSG